MYINTYNLTGQALQDAWGHNERQRAIDLAARIAHMQRVNPRRAALKRLAAYLAIRLNPAWLNASPDLLEGYLPMRWETTPHHEIVDYLLEHDTLPGNCIE